MTNPVGRKHIGLAWDAAWQHPYQTPLLGSLFDAVESGETGAWGAITPHPSLMRCEGLDAMMRCAINRSLQILQRGWAHGPLFPRWLEEKDASAKFEVWLKSMAYRYGRQSDWVEAGRQIDELPAEVWPENLRDGPMAKRMEWLLNNAALKNSYPWSGSPKTKFLWGDVLTAEREPLLGPLIEDAGEFRRQNLLHGLCLGLKNGEAFGPDKLRHILDRAHQQGLIVWIVELAVHSTDDQTQKNLFAALWSEIWQHPAVTGVTLGNLEERPRSESFNREQSEGCLIRWDRSERPAFAWLREFVGSQRAPGGGVLTGPALGELTKRLDRPFGSTLHSDSSGENKVRESSLLGATDAFRMASASGEPCVWRAPGEYDFRAADEHLALAKSNDLPFCAHVPVFGASAPNWLRAGTFSVDEIRRMLKEYILGLVGRYKGQVQSWVFHREEAGPQGDFWSDQLGRDYQRMIFEWAHEADPAALLFYGDEAIEAVNARSDAVFAMLAGLIKEGVPIHGVAFRSNYAAGELRSNLGSIEENIRRFGELGLKVHFSAVELRLRRPADYDRLLVQAEEYRRLVELFLRMPEVSSCLLRNHGEEAPAEFCGGGAPGLFIRNEPQPAYFAVQDAFLQKTVALG